MEIRKEICNVCKEISSRCSGIFPAVCPAEKRVVEAAGGTEITLERDTYMNPISGKDDKGNLIYGGDPAVLVDGDTVYLYTGHDTSKNESYVIPEWVCYSSKDMKTWKYENVIMKADSKSITWANTETSAWAAQTAKHYDKEAGKDRYYFYFCTWDKAANGEQSIGVAVSDSPTGPFVDKGEPLVKGTVTTDRSSGYNDIDPTVWVETDEKGEEHRYLAWGNNQLYICELNEDMVSVKDMNGDGKITFGNDYVAADIVNRKKGIASLTEAPWLYRRQNADGSYYGPYYLFYAYGFREQMAYVTTDNLLTGEWKSGGVLMPATASSDTNHMAVFDFKGKTYFVYHNGMLPGGSGHRRSASVTELKFNEDGSIQPILETVIGLSGTTTKIYCNSGKTLSHETFSSSPSDSKFPFQNVKAGPGLGSQSVDGDWVIMDGKADAANKAYVSIQAENKPGLYLTTASKTKVVLAQDVDASSSTAKKQTFRTIQGLSNKDGVTFESVAYPGYYLTVVNGALKMTKGADKMASTFYTGIDKNDKSLRSIAATMKKNQFHIGDKVDAGRVTLTAFYANGSTKKIKKFSSNASKISTKKRGSKTLKITYKEGNISCTTNVEISIVPKPTKVKKLKASIKVKKGQADIKLSWKRPSYCTGYEISYGRTKKKHSFLSDTKENPYTYTDIDKVFKKGKTYYLHVRSSAKFNGKKEYSGYVTVKVKAK